MAHKSKVPLQRVTINLYAGDFERLTNLFPDITATRAIRELVRGIILQTEARSNQVATDMENQLELPLELSRTNTR